MFYSDEKRALLDVVLAVPSPSPALTRAIRVLQEDIAFSGTRDDRPAHIGWCSCAPGTCRNSRNEWGKKP